MSHIVLQSMRVAVPCHHKTPTGSKYGPPHISAGPHSLQAAADSMLPPHTPGAPAVAESLQGHSGVGVQGIGAEPDDQAGGSTPSPQLNAASLPARGSEAQETAAVVPRQRPTLFGVLGKGRRMVVNLMRRLQQVRLTIGPRLRLPLLFSQLQCLIHTFLVSVLQHLS